MSDPYVSSAALRKLLRARDSGLMARIACMDIDSTLTGEPAVADAVRDELERRDIVVGFNTSRTEEMILSSSAFAAASRDGAFCRPQPQLAQRGPTAPGWGGERRESVPPEDVEPRGILDGDFIAASSGTRLLVKQVDGRYLVDRAYEGRYGVSPEDWRDRTLAVLRALWSRGVPGELAEIEDPENYRLGRTDIFPPLFRVQVNFDALEEKRRFEGELAETARTGRSLAHAASSLWITDDSHPGEGRWKVFVTPRGGTKAHAAEWLVARLSEKAEMCRRRLQILYTGDSFPDLEMGLFGGLGTDATLLLAGGSRLVEALTSESSETFAGRSLRAYRQRLRRTDIPGAYRFRLPCGRCGERGLLIGDRLYPGTTAVESVLRHVTALPEAHPVQDRRDVELSAR